MINMLMTERIPFEQISDLSIGKCSKSISYVYAITNLDILELKTFNSSPFVMKSLKWMNDICDNPKPSFESVSYYTKYFSFTRGRIHFTGRCFPFEYKQESELLCILKFQLRDFTKK